MENDAKQQKQENVRTLFAGCDSLLTGATETSGSQPDANNNNNNNQLSESDAFECLSSLYRTLREPIPENPSASYIADTAHRLVEDLNAKRKNDAEIVQRFKMALDAQTMKYVEILGQQLYQMYEIHNSQVDKKLQDLFACLDNISATENELENFRESLSKLYQEMHEIS